MRPFGQGLQLRPAMAGSTVEDPAKVANPQSVPAITRSRPTRETKRAIRWATSLGDRVILLLHGVSQREDKGTPLPLSIY